MHNVCSEHHSSKAFITSGTDNQYWLINAARNHALNPGSIKESCYALHVSACRKAAHHRAFHWWFQWCFGCHVDFISNCGNLTSGILGYYLVRTASVQDIPCLATRCFTIRLLESCHPDIARACRQYIHTARIVSHLGHGLQMPSRSGVGRVRCKCRDCMEQLQA